MLRNDFEPWAFQQHALLPQIRDYLYAQGAGYAAMSGSGSALFGVFSEKPQFTDSFLAPFVQWEGLL